MPPFLIGRLWSPAPPRDRPGADRGARRSSLASGARVAVVVIELAVAPVTLGMSAAFVLVGRVSRWRPMWLTVPAIVGVGWTVSAGGGQAVAGFLLVGGHLVRILAGPVPVAAHPARFVLLASLWRRALPLQVPIALIAAAAQARMAAALAAGRRFRPGLLALARGACVRAALRRGELATPDGCRVGVFPCTGRQVTVSWEEARGGVLVTGSDQGPVASTALGLAIAAIQHRKTVIIVDLTDGGTSSRDTLPAAVIAACTAARAPVAVLDAGRGHYDPFSVADPHRATGLLSAMIDWEGIGPERRRACEHLVREAFRLIAVTQPHPGLPRADALDEVRALIRSAGQLAAPATAAALAAQLGELRSTALGTRLSRPGPGGGEPIDLARAITRRECVLFCLDRNAAGRPGAAVAGLILTDIAGVLADRAALGSPADCLVLVNGCEPGDIDHVAALLATGRMAGSALVACTASTTAADRLSGAVNVLAVRGRPPCGSAAQATAAGAADTAAGEILFSHEESQDAPTVQLRLQRPDELTILIRNPRPRLVAGCRAAR